MMKEFTPEELQKCDGRDGRPVFAAVNGNVYDLSESKLWKTGTHMSRHRAGNDLSEVFPQAPHGTEVFERVKRVGTLGQPAAAGEIPAWAKWLLGFHPHPIMVHFPQAFFSFAPLFFIMSFVFKNIYFERTAFYLLACGILMSIPTLATGVFHWIYKYGKSPKGIFKFKIAMSVALVAYACILFYVHNSRGTVNVNVLDATLTVMYFIIIPIAASLGHAGGIIVFGGRKQDGISEISLRMKNGVRFPP